MPSRSFWKGRNVFVTGHTGFKGSWLSLWLDSLGARVTGFAKRAPTEPNLFALARVSGCVQTIYGDVRDFTLLKKALEESHPDVVIHMAAQSVVRRSYEDPVETYSSNVMGTVHVLEAIRELGRPCVVVVVTSDKCYENKEWDWGYRENDPLGGDDPYSNSKACAELVTSAFRSSFFCKREPTGGRIAVASARAGNVIGGGDWTRDQLIPDMLRAFLEGRPCLIRNRHSVRPWQFVLEPLRGYLDLAERLVEDPDKFAAAWNFGPSDLKDRPVSWIADELTRLWGDSASWTEDGGTHPPEAHSLRLDNTKTRALMGWSSAVPLSTALAWIVEWYRAFQSKGDLHRATRAQIERYEELLHT